MWRGSYSDRYIVGVCTTEEKARRLVELYTDSWDSANYTSWILDEIPECPPGLLPYSVVMTYQGSSEARGESIDHCIGRTEYYGADNKMYFSIFAKDERHAVKIANERRAQMIALNI